MGALLLTVGASLKELVRLLCSLRNQISSSAHSSVVRGHVEFQTLGSSASNDKKSMRLKPHWGSKEETRLLAGEVQN